MHRGVYATGSGMHCLWDRKAFASVSDYDSWERELLQDQDIARHISAGALVPLNIGSDGAMAIEVRLGTSGAPAALSERETTYLIVRSEPFLFRSSGSIGVGGLESVEGAPRNGVGTVELPPGDYAATVHLIAWDEEPGMQTDDGPAADALPDYVVLLQPAEPSTKYRQKIETFERPE